MGRVEVGVLDAGARPGFQASLRQLKSAQKPGRGAPPYSRWVNRRLGRVLAALAASRGMTPNMVTVASACCTFTALGLVATVSPHWWLGLVVAALLVLGYALDAADGQLARLLGGGSPAGEWLDHVVDAVKANTLHGVVLVSFFRFTDASSLMLGAALAFQVVYSVMFFGMILTDQLRRSAGQTLAAKGAGARPLQTLAAVPTDFGLMCLCFSLIGFQHVFRPAYSLLLVLNAVILLGTAHRWWGQVNTLPRGRPS